MKKKKPKQKFDPGHKYIDLALKEYLSQGGKITKIEVLPSDIPRVFKDFRSGIEFSP